jgi:hypothetical protein
MNWHEFKYFTEDEFRPPGYEAAVSMSLGFMLKLEAMRSQLGSPFVIHRNGGFAVAGHADNSLHYAGLAADLHICAPGTREPRDVVEQALLAWKWSFLSIGIYPFWNQPGLHLDDRTAAGLEKTVWFRDRGGKYHCYPYNQFHRCLDDLIRHRAEKPPRAVGDSVPPRAVSGEEVTRHEQAAHV